MTPFDIMVDELQARMTIEAIAEALNVEPRQVWRWKAKTDKPSGMNAINLYLFHAKHCPASQCPEGHSEGSEQTLKSA